MDSEAVVKSQAVADPEAVPRQRWCDMDSGDECEAVPPRCRGRRHQKRRKAPAVVPAALAEVPPAEPPAPCLCSMVLKSCQAEEEIAKKPRLQG